MSQIITHV